MAELNADKFWTGRLMTHMAILCKKIGPRPSTSARERQAAEYVKEILQQLGCQDIQEQTFHSPNSMGWVICLIFLVASLAIPVAWIGGQWGKLIGCLVLVGSAYLLRENFLAKRPFFHRLIAWGSSQNIIANILPSETVKQRVYLIGHLDTQKQRFLSPPPNAGQLKFLSTASILTPVMGGIFLLIDVITNQQGIAWWEWTIGILISLSLLGCLLEEWQPHIEGANDNATAVSILLTIAEILQTQPLRHTEVVLLFTGCEEVMCVGMENYLRQYKPPKENTYWIDLEMVGTGNLCYVTRHGVSYLTQYEPAPDMVGLAARTAQRNPDLAVLGKDMLIVEEVANLRNQGYQAICLAGYSEKGYLPNWHRLSDTLENIEPETLNRANRFTMALLQEIDC